MNEDMELPTLSESSCLLREDRGLARLWHSLPPSVQIFEWTLLYRLSDHGASLATMIARAANVEHTLLVVQDTMVS